MTIGGETVEVWLDEISLVSHGHIEGRVEVRRWSSPEYGVAVREELWADAKKGLLTYFTDYSVQLISLRPSRQTTTTVKSRQRYLRGETLVPINIGLSLRNDLRKRHLAQRNAKELVDLLT